MTIGERLKEERERLALTQPAFAAIAGLRKNTVILWEKDSGAPKANALSALAEAGVDVLYVLTGKRCSLSRSPNELVDEVEADIDAIESDSAAGFEEKLREYALDSSLPDRVKARADEILDRHGDVDAGKRIEERDRRREDAYKRARRVVREARFVVEWEPSEKLEAAMIRLVVNLGADGPTVEEILRAVRDEVTG